jgi:hypothetical protein
MVSSILVRILKYPGSEAAVPRVANREIATVAASILNKNAVAQVFFWKNFF